MFNRFCFGALLLACLALTFTGCNNTPGLTTIVISPATVTVTLAPPGFQQGINQYKAIGYYGHADHQTTADITSQVTWSSSGTQVATINSSGLATATGYNPSTGEGWTGITNITASAPGFNGVIVSNNATFTVTSCTSCVNSDISTITVLPATQTIASLGVPIQFEAVGLTVSGTSEALTNLAGIHWVSSAPSVATINAATGLATTVGSGTTTITATFTNSDGSGAVGSATLTVAASGSPEPLTALIVAPNAQTALSIGQTAQFLAIATTGSGASVNLTNQSATVGLQTIQPATWVSSNPSVATINPATGVATSVAAGATVITAIAKNPDGSVVTGAATYTVTVTGSSSSEPLVSLAIVPVSQTLTAAGQTAGLIAIGTTSSGTTVNLTNQTATVGTATIQAATWSSSVPSVVSINAATGVATAVANGTTAVTAIAKNPDGTVVTGVATLTVNIPSSPEPLVSLAIVPAAQTLTAANQTAGLIVIGTTTNGTTVNLTNMPATIGSATISAASWKSSVSTVASIDPASGVVTAHANGTTAITAMAANPDGTVVTGIATLTVSIPATPEPLVSIAILPSTQSSTSTGTAANVTFFAIGTTGAGGTVLLSNTVQTVNGQTINPVSWSSSNSSVANFASSSSGTATPKASGATAIIAVVTNPDNTVVTGTAAYTVTASSSSSAEPLTAVTIYPPNPSVSVPNVSSQLLAIGTFSATPTTQDVTSGITNLDGVANQNITTNWSSSDTSVATVTTACPTGLTAESCTLSACPAGSSGATCTTCVLPRVAAGSSCALLNQATPIGTVTGVNKGNTVIMSLSKNPDGTLVPATTTFSVQSGSVETYTALTIIPGSIAATSPGQVNQFLALATGSSGLQYDVTSQVVWKSNTIPVASICTAVAGVSPATPISCATTPGLVTAATAGSTNITATWINPDQTQQVASATYSVTIGAAPEPLISINVVPSSTQVSNKGMTQQYLAFGTFTTTPTLRDITDSVTWITLNPNLVSINSAGTPGEVAGLATAMGYEGLGVIYAEGTNADNTVVLSNPVTFTCQEPGTSPPICDPSVAPALLATLTVFNAGSNSTSWLITAPSDTGVPNLIHCGPGSEIAGLGNSVCTGTYAAGTNVTITASLAGAALDNTFGGWTANCDTVVDTPNMTNTCALPTLSYPTGTGYTTAAGLPTVTSGVGIGALISITASAGNLTSCTATTPGSGYLVGNVVYPIQAGATGSSCVVTEVSGTGGALMMSASMESGGDPSGLVGNQSVGALFYGLTLSCPAVTSGHVGVAFNSGALTASGGTAPYTYAVVGTLPTGLTINTTTGAVTGTPTASGSFSITVTDANGTVAASNCTITII